MVQPNRENEDRSTSVGIPCINRQAAATRRSDTGGSGRILISRPTSFCGTGQRKKVEDEYTLALINGSQVADRFVAHHGKGFSDVALFHGRGRRLLSGMDSISSVIELLD
jgi:hypothetical protein